MPNNEKSNNKIFSRIQENATLIAEMQQTKKYKFKLITHILADISRSLAIIADCMLYDKISDKLKEENNEESNS